MSEKSIFERTEIITPGQLFSILFICTTVVGASLGSISTGYKDFWDWIISCGVSYLITFIMIIPAFFLSKCEPKLDLIDMAWFLFGKAGFLINIIYVLYFTSISFYTIVLFKSFIQDVINPPISFSLLILVLIFLTCYGAYKGIEGIARASSVFLFFIFISIIFLGVSLLKMIDPTNFKPFFYNGTKNFVRGTIFFVSRNSCISAMTFLLPLVKGEKKYAVFFWNTIFYIFIALSIVFITGTLGEFAQTRMLPIYSISSIAKIGTLENLDAFFLALWLLAIFMKLSLFTNLTTKCFRRIFGTENSKIVIFIVGILLTIGAFFTDIKEISNGIFNTNIFLIITIFTSFIIPLMCLFFNMIKRRCKEI